MKIWLNIIAQQTETQAGAQQTRTRETHVNTRLGGSTAKQILTIGHGAQQRAQHWDNRQTDKRRSNEMVQHDVGGEGGGVVICLRGIV